MWQRIKRTSGKDLEQKVMDARMAVDYGPSVDISDIEDIPVTEEHNNVGGKVMDNNMQNMMVITFKK